MLLALNIDVIVPAIERAVRHRSSSPRRVYHISDLPSDLQRGDVVPIALIALVLALVATIYPELARGARQPGGGAAL